MFPVLIAPPRGSISPLCDDLPLTNSTIPECLVVPRTGRHWSLAHSSHVRVAVSRGNHRHLVDRESPTGSDHRQLGRPRDRPGSAHLDGEVHRRPRGCGRAGGVSHRASEVGQSPPPAPGSPVVRVTEATSPGGGRIQLEHPPRTSKRSGGAGQTPKNGVAGGQRRQVPTAQPERPRISNRPRSPRAVQRRPELPCRTPQAQVPATPRSTVMR